MNSCRLYIRASVRGALVAVILGLLMVGRSASAATALIVEPLVDGSLAPSELAQLRAAAEDALRAQQLEIIPARDLEIAVSAEPQLKGCYSELCFEQLNRLLGSQLIVRYRVKGPVPSGTKGEWHLKVELFDGEVGAVGARISEDCRGCMSAQAAEKLGDMIRQAVIKSTALPRGVLAIRSKPPGAAVFVDGTELGITPYKRAAFIGKHKLVLRHVGYRTEQIDAVVEETPGRAIDVTLTRGTDQPPVYKKWWFWVAIGGAALAAGAITAGIVVGTRGSSDRTLPDNNVIINF
jgi:hypothetical protein